VVKVKLHQAEPAHEEADIQADKAISSEDVPTEWRDRTNRSVLTWQEPRRKEDTVSYDDRKSTWNSRVRKAIRRGLAEEEVRKHRDPVTGVWKQISKQTRRVDVSYDLSMVMALRHGTWMDEESLKKTCIQKKEKRGGIHQPFYGTWVVDFMLKQDAGKFMLEKYLSDKKKSMEAKDTCGDGGGRNYTKSKFFNQNRQDAINRESAVQNNVRGPRWGSEHTDGLAAETHGYINNAGCEGMAMAGTAAHHSIWRHLYDSTHAAKKPKSKLKFVTLDKESGSSSSTMWPREVFPKICSKEDLAEKAQDINQWGSAGRIYFRI